MCKKFIGTDVGTPLTCSEVRKAIMAGKSHRAPGPDGLCNEHLKVSCSFLVNIWTELLSKCLITGNIPEAWRKLVIKLLYKGKGNVSSPESYRGIALESLVFKLFTRLLTERLSSLVEPLLPDEQFGFRRGRSTIIAAGNLLRDIHQKIEEHKKLYVLFIDYTKAFDTVNRCALIKKLENLIGRSGLTRVI